MTRAAIFDLDQTLLNTSSLQALRDQRQWEGVYRKIPELIISEEINQMMTYLNNNNIQIIVITTSPRPYCSKIISHSGWTITGQICYHDVLKRKPDPEAFTKAINDYHLDIAHTISAGDRDMDIKASNALNIPSIACTWDSPNKQSLLSANPTFIAHTPNELFRTIKQFFN